MPTPATLRENARLYRRSAASETAAPLKLRLARHALALLQLAERIEREEAARAEAPS
jgi:hypothetical protein